MNFQDMLYNLFYFAQNAVYFIMLPFSVHIMLMFFIKRTEIQVQIPAPAG
jgi:hypothetical protein